jgi:hypothetical protein
LAWIVVKISCKLAKFACTVSENSKSYILLSFLFCLVFLTSSCNNSNSTMSVSLDFASFVIWPKDMKVLYQLCVNYLTVEPDRRTKGGNFTSSKKKTRPLAIDHAAANTATYTASSPWSARIRVGLEFYTKEKFFENSF